MILIVNRAFCNWETVLLPKEIDRIAKTKRTSPNSETQCWRLYKGIAKEIDQIENYPITVFNGIFSQINHCSHSNESVFQ